MKILELSPYAYFKGKKGFKKNRSGFAYAVSDTCKALADNGDDVYLITQSAITNGFEDDGVIIPRKRWKDILINVSISDFSLGIQAIKGYHAKYVTKLKVIYYFLNTGYVKKQIRLIDPDIIHIQSIGFYTIPFMLAAAASGKPFIITNHGLVTFLDSDSVDSKQKKMEGIFFNLASRYETQVTVVSSGIKNRITEYLKVKGDNITVILNSYEPTCLKKNLNYEKLLKNHLGIDHNSITYICVGSISKRKNQIQIARAYNLIDDSIRHRIKIIFAGSGPQERELREYIIKHELSPNLIVCGNIDHEELANYYRIADYTITASKDEGFGLPIIEGYYFGLPAVAFSDLDAISDINNEKSSLLVYERTDQALANGILKVLDIDWDREAIKKIAQNFSREKMAQNYHKIFEYSRKNGSGFPFEEIAKLI